LSLIVALDYAGDDEDKLNHLFAQLDAAEERFQKGEDFDDEPLPGADDGPDYVGLDPFAKADELEQSKPYY